MKTFLLLLILNSAILALDEGCTANKPALCKKDSITNEPICKERYEDCDGFEGCIDPRRPYLCSNGECAENFNKCNIKYFNCENLK